MPLGAIGPYELLNELGRGGAGTVYRARDARSGREVALKLLGRERSANQVARARFSREVAALTRLRHPAVIPVLDAGEHEGRPFLVMELVPGSSLEAWLARHGPFAPREAAEVVREVARALEVAHARGLLHRDVKPANVLRTSAGKVVLTDFGLTKDLGAESQSLSRTGQFLGTPGYWAPEQAGGEHDALGPEVDVWGLGATLYALLTGRPPLDAGDLLTALGAAERGAIVAPSERRPGVPRDLEAICLRCLARDPGARYASASEVVAELGRFLEGRAPRARRGSGLAVRVLALTLGMAALASGVTLGVRDRPGPTATPPLSGVESEAPPTPRGVEVARLVRDGRERSPACPECRPGADPTAEVETLRLLARVPLPQAANDLTALSWSPDGKRLVIGWMDGRVELLETEGWTVANTSVAFEGPSGLGLAWNPEGDRLGVVALQGTRAALDDMTGVAPRPAGQLVRAVGAPDFVWVSRPVFFPREGSGQRLVACVGLGAGEAGTWLHEMEIGPTRPDGRVPVQERRLDLPAAGPISLSRDGRWLATTLGRGEWVQGQGYRDRFTLHDLSGRLPPTSLSLTSKETMHGMALRVAPDGRCLGVISSGRELYAFHCESGTGEGDAYRAHGGEVIRLAFSGDSRHLVTASRRELAIRRAWTWPWDELFALPLPQPLFELATSPVDGRIAALCATELVVYELLVEPAK